MPSLSDDQVITRIKSVADQCPTPTIKLAMIDTVVDFYERTLISQPDLTPIDTLVDTPVYIMPIPIGYVFVQAMEVRLNKIALTEESAQHLDLFWGDLSKSYSYSYRHDFAFGGLDSPSWRDATAVQPRFYHFEPDGRIRLVGIPTVAYAGSVYGLKIRAALKPIARLLTSIDDAVWDDYYQTLVSGCLSRILIMPNKTWTNLKLAEYHGAQYDKAREEVRGEIARSNIRNDREITHSRAYA